MKTEETKSILTVALMAAFADGLKDEREREAVKQVADALGGESGVDLPALYRDVLLSSRTSPRSWPRWRPDQAVRL